MLAALIIWSYLALLLYLYGASFASLLSRWLRVALPSDLGLPLTLLLGLIVLGTLAAALSLFIPLGWIAALLLLAVGVLLYAIARPPFPWKIERPGAVEVPGILVLLLAGLVILSSATRPTSNPDTNLYHSQSIRWVETFPAIPGLGNLSGRLALNSDWLVLNAATSFAFLGLRSFHLVAGLLFLLAALYLGDALLHLARQPGLLSNWLKLLLLPLAFRVLISESSSPGTDLPVVLLTWMLFVLMAEHVEAQARQASSLRPILIAILPAFMVTLKLSAAPLMLVSAWMLLMMLRRQQAPRLWMAAALILLILLPWIVRSVILSGYLVFPYSRLDIFTFDWKVPSSEVDSLRNAIVGWARQPDKDWAQVAKLPLTMWLPGWFGQQTPNQRLMIVAALLTPLGLLFRPLRKYAAPLLINYFAIGFWLFSAPNLRFGYGFLLTGIGFLAAAALAYVAGRFRPGQARLLSIAGAALLALFFAYTLVSTLDVGTLGRRLLLPVDYAKFRTVACAAGDLQLSCAAAYRQCGYQSFPCVPNVPARVVPRGSALQDGFASTK